MVDKSRELGRKLTAEEINQIFAETLPKKCRPKVITTKEEIIPFYERMGYTHEQAHAAAYQPNVGGMCVPNGSGKNPIYVPVKSYPSISSVAETTAHELEHALERNNRLKGIVMRHLLTPYLVLKSFTNKNFMQKVNRLELSENKVQIGLQHANKTLDDIRVEPVINCPPTSEGLAKVNGLSEKRYKAQIRSIIRNVLNGKSEGSENIFRMRSLKDVFDIEIPAYTVGGRVQRYALNLGENQMAKGTDTAILYEDAQKILKSEKRLYLKNMLLGRLKAPMVYQSEKDILKLCKTKEDKNIVKSIIESLKNDEDAKSALFTLIKKKPEYLQNIKTFMDKTSVDGQNIYARYIPQISRVNPAVLENPDFIKIAKIMDNYNEPAYACYLRDIAKSSPDRIKMFSEIADARMADGRMKYTELAECLRSKNFDKLKALADIEVNGTNPYVCFLPALDRLMSAKVIEKITEKAAASAKNGENISLKIEQAIDFVSKELQKRTSK
ncbi:hypothetical protein J6E39_04180 [bacterium]|nr:hypothetical protein [bacterium]